MALDRLAREQRDAAAAHMARTRSVEHVPAEAAAKAVETDGSRQYKEAMEMAEALVKGDHAEDDAEREMMVNCLNELMAGGKVIMGRLEDAKSTGRAIIFGHLKQGVSVRSLVELANKTDIKSGPLFQQVQRIFNMRKDVQVVEIWPSHIH